ncbi:MAG: hypothetical protein M3Y59_24445 [Myxococcota bacterium]|nr:hypothetical protein [Myxococcota bacterium]
MKSPLLHLLPAALAASLLVGCDQDPTRKPCGQSVAVPIAPAYTFLRVKLEAGETCAWPLHVNARPEIVDNAVVYRPVDVLVELRVEVEAPERDTTPDSVHTSLDGVDQPEPGWVGIHTLATGEHVLRVTSDQAAELRFIIRSEGELPQSLNSALSLEWPTNNRVVSDKDVVGLGRMMALISAEGHGGPLLAHWLASFESTEGPSRSGPAALLAHLQAQRGADPALWNLDELNFSVSSVQNRIDLRDATSCGQLRVVITATDTGFEEAFQMVFLFKQPPRPLDYSPQGTLHCTATALVWARLSKSGALPTDGQNPIATAIGEVLQRANFLRVKTSEKIGAETDYEFREWVLAVNPDPAAAPALRNLLVNRPMFQTVDTQRLNTPGAERDAFIAYVSDNAAALNARTALIPQEFLAVATRADGVNWTPLDLSGVPQPTLDAFPQLRQQIEVVGCTGCHTSRAGTKLIHSRRNGGHSAYLLEELSARTNDLLKLSTGVPEPVPYGPLQANPVLPP